MALYRPEQELRSPVVGNGHEEALARAILVLGMHRSGTSALTRVLSLRGAALPQRIAPPAEDNERGFWEPLHIVNLNDEILTSAGSSWDDISEFPASWFTSDIATPFRNRLATALNEDFSDAPLFVLKDPRLCRLLPLWLTVLKERAAIPYAVICVRNPLEVAASLKQRNNLSEAHTLMLWLRHYLTAERDSRKLKRSFVTYQSLLHDWRRAVDKISVDLGFQFPRQSHKADAEIDDFISIELRHHTFSYEDVHSRPEIVRWAKDAFDWLQRASAGSTNPEKLDRISRELEIAETAFMPVIAAAELSRTKLLEEATLLKKQLVRKDSELAASRDDATQELAAAAALRQAEVESLRSTALALEQSAASRERLIEDLCIQVDDAKAALRTRELESEHLRTQLADLEPRLTAYRCDLDEVRAQLATAEGEIAERDVQVAHLRADSLREITELSDEIRSAESELAKRDLELTALRVRFVNTEDEARRRATELSALRHDLSEALAENARITDVLSRSSASISELKLQMADVKSAIASREDELSRVRIRISDAETRLAAKMREIDGVRIELARAQASIAQRDIEIGALEARFTTTQETLAARDAELFELRASVVERDLHLEERGRELTELKEQLATTQGELASSSEALTARQREVDELRKQLQSRTAEAATRRAELDRVTADRDDLARRLDETTKLFTNQTEALIAQTRAESERVAQLIETVQSSHFWRLKRWLSRIFGFLRRNKISVSP